MKHLLFLIAVFAMVTVGMPASAFDEGLIEDLAKEMEMAEEENPTPDPACAQKCSATFRTSMTSCKGTTQEAFKCAMTSLLEFMKCTKACTSK